MRYQPGVKNIVEIDNQFYILATSSLAGVGDRVLKCGETFAVFDQYGDIKPVGMAEEGLYHEGTRYLSCLILHLGHDRPMLLSSTVRDDNALVTVDLTNLDIFEDGHLTIPRGTLHLSRTACLGAAACYERLTFRNYGLVPIVTSALLVYDADYADIFEVRGLQRERRGARLDSLVETESVTLSYRGLDDVVRRTHIRIEPAPVAIGPTEARLRIELMPGGEVTFDVTFACDREDQRSARLGFEASVADRTETLRARRAEACRITTSNEQFNDWIKRSLADLSMMTTETPSGLYPYAGVPWFSTPFGRDGLITALSCLWIDPGLARGVLSYLADTQASAINVEQDAQPGKILHETRLGEMAALHEIPFGRYYGSHDSTPLFVMLAAAYYERTGDASFIERLWPHVDRALEWIDQYGDLDGDGFIEYLRQSPNGLVHQGWKDSHDAIFHRDGRLAEGPIALCEVQGYVYAAWRGAADLLRMLGQPARAKVFAAKADTLRRRFNERFWCEEIGTYAMALDGDKRPCAVRTSNAGHTLLTGIASKSRAPRVARTLMAEESFSGWGIRTVATSERRYNPMSYHNGSIWPHDNALIAFGLARYGLPRETRMVFGGLFDASLFVDLHRLPELYCGFPRRAGESPTLYPVACAPQAWAAASVFLLLQASLGLEVNGPRRRIQLCQAQLPPFLDQVEIRQLKVGGAVVDLALTRHENSVAVRLLRREGNVDVVSLK